MKTNVLICETSKTKLSTALLGSLLSQMCNCGTCATAGAVLASAQWCLLFPTELADTLFSHLRPTLSNECTGDIISFMSQRCLKPSQHSPKQNQYFFHALKFDPAPALPECIPSLSIQFNNPESHLCSASAPHMLCSCYINKSCSFASSCLFSQLSHSVSTPATTLPCCLSRRPPQWPPNHQATPTLPPSNCLPHIN